MDGPQNVLKRDTDVCRHLQPQRLLASEASLSCPATLLTKFRWVRAGPSALALVLTGRHDEDVTRRRACVIGGALQKRKLLPSQSCYREMRSGQVVHE
jgi:hypothetical protein